MRYHTGSAIIPLVLFSITSSAVADSLAEIARRVPGKARRASSGVYDPESNRDSYHIGPGETQVLTELDGPGEIRHMWFTIAGHDRRYPRSLVLRIYWDGADVPSVETPVGDFFAAGNGMRADVNTLPIQVTSYGRALNCYWRMPFRKNARIELTNEGSNRLGVYWQFDWMDARRTEGPALFPRPVSPGVPGQTVLALRDFRGRGRRALRGYRVLDPVQLRELVRRVGRSILHRR